MNRFFPIGISAGLASALLFASLGTGSPVALVLFQISPLPILLAAIGWGQAASLIAAGIAGMFILAVLGVEMGALHMASVGVPAWWLSHLATLAQPGEDDAPVWYPLGRVVMWIAAIAITIACLSPLVVAGSVSAYEQMLRDNVLTALNSGSMQILPDGFDRERAADTMVMAMPPVFAAFSAIVWLFNIWIAARVARASGRLLRPWQDLPATRLPMIVLPAFTIAVLIMFLPAPFDYFGRIAATVLLLILGLIGLTVVHFVTRGMASRPLLLSATYFVLLIQIIGAMFVLAVLGIAEQLFGVRARFAARRSSRNLRH